MSRARNRAGFTLIELLVVIAIIAVLAGIIVPVFGKVQEKGRKVLAVNDMRSIKAAIIGYYGDYRKYPLTMAQQSTGQSGGGDAVYGDPGGTYTSADLFSILRAYDDGNYNANNQLNPTQTVYWPGKFVDNPNRPREGITTQDITVNGNVIPKGSLVDPWGNSYIIYFDADNDGDLSAVITAHKYTDAGTVKVGSAPLGLAFASLGPDGKFGTKGNGLLKNADDVVSWVQP